MKKFNLKQLLFIASGGTTLFACHALYSGNPKFYSQVVMPSVHKLTTAENAHNFAIFCAKVLTAQYNMYTYNKSDGLKKAS